MANGERGPKKEYPAAVYVRLLPEQREFVEKLGDGNLSEGVRRAIDFARQNAERRPPGRPPGASSSQ